MNEALKAEWVKALRSYEYSKCVEVLKEKHGENEVAYCALGVLCDILPGFHWEPSENRYMRIEYPMPDDPAQFAHCYQPGGFAFDRIRSLMRSRTVTDQEISEIAKSRLATYPEELAFHVAGLDKATTDKVVAMNDEARWSFSRIANWIEANL